MTNEPASQLDPRVELMHWALRVAIDAFNAAPSFKVGRTDSYSIAAMLGDVIAATPEYARLEVRS